MIKQGSLDELKSAIDLVEIMNLYTKVKRDFACCPIHQEKTPSLKIYSKKQTFKCFGCGESGDAIKLIMKMERLNFVEAAEWLANYFNIVFEYDKVSIHQTQEAKDKLKEMIKLTEWVNAKYCKELLALPPLSDAFKYLRSRGYNEERIKAWDLGYAPDRWKFITTPIINEGWHAPAVEAGLIYCKDGKSWDFYRNRITIPIHDHNGIIVGIAGRLLPGKEEGENKQPKYMNPKESLLYCKKKVWYGLWQAQSEIKNRGFVYLVEGYFDVQAMHDNDILNTISPCGTEVDLMQAKFLKRYTSNVVIAFDSDPAGTKKKIKIIDLFLELDFKVSVLDFPEEMDPDEYINSRKVIELQ